jgi:hypothetical protein
MKAGIIGMVGAGLWVLSVFIQNRYNLFGLGSGPLYPFHQVLAFIALAAMVVGFWGLVWGGAMQGRFGRIAVTLYAISWGMIILAGLVALIFQTEDSLIFILFPIGGTLADISGLLIGIAVVRAKRWAGWQRFMPLLSFLVIFFAVNLPFVLGATAGPGVVGELIQGVCWFGVALAVYTVSKGEGESVISLDASV